MNFSLRCFESSSFHWCLRVLSNMSYKFYYYCFFYLSSFEERKTFCVSKRTEKCHEYYEVNLDDCIDIEILELFSLNWWNHISSRFQFEEMKRYLVSNQFWDEQKSFFSLWKRSVNNVRVKIRCHETRMLWAAKDIKKVRFWLYEVRFIIEIDINILIIQFNRSAINFSKVLMIR